MPDPTFSAFCFEGCEDCFFSEEDDWVSGVQFFLDLDYLFETFFIGGNAKYQMTEDFENGDFDLNNWKIGAQIGLKF